MVSKMFQWMKTLAALSDDLSSNSRIHIVKERTNSKKDLHMHTHVHTHPYKE